MCRELRNAPGFPWRGSIYFYLLLNCIITLRWCNSAVKFLWIYLPLTYIRISRICHFSYKCSQYKPTRSTSKRSKGKNRQVIRKKIKEVYTRREEWFDTTRVKQHRGLWLETFVTLLFHKCIFSRFWYKVLHCDSMMIIMQSDPGAVWSVLSRGSPALPTRGRWRMFHGRAKPGIVSDLTPWPLGKLSSES